MKLLICRLNFAVNKTAGETTKSELTIENKIYATKTRKIDC